jgi:excisionase family DNA binding protein
MSNTDFFPKSWRGRPVITAKEVAEAIGVHSDDVYRMAANEEIPSRKLGARRQFLTIEIVRWLGGEFSIHNAA